VELLFTWAWTHDLAGDPFKRLDGLKTRKTALSDHLLSLMTEWKSSFAGVLPHFELVFDRFETLASLAYFDRLSKDEVKAELANQAGCPWMPVGRVWNRKSLEIILRDIEGEQASALLKAGFARDDRERLPLFVENIRRIARRI
jgi:hypothetical protein